MFEQNCPKCEKLYKLGAQACAYCGFVFPFSTDVLGDSVTLQHRYEIQRLIHSGGMGYIYLATDIRLDRQVVIKQVKEAVKSERHLEQLEKEALNMAQLNHPNVAMILDHFTENNYYFLVVEYVLGKTLSEVLDDRGQNLQEVEVVRWMIPVCDALGYMHRHGMIHRDISPDNIMLTPDGHIKLVDFGTLHELSEIAGKKVGKEGKFGFTPPEQWQGNPIAQSDIFAVGATIYYLLTGYLPVSDECRMSGKPQPSDYSPLFPPVTIRNREISNHMESILLKTLKTEYQLRYEHICDLEAELSALISEKNVYVKEKAGLSQEFNINITDMSSIKKSTSNIWRKVTVTVAVILIVCLFYFLFATFSRMVGPLPAALDIQDSETSINMQPDSTSSYYTRSINNSGGQPLKGDVLIDVNWLHANPLTLYLEPGEATVLQYWAETYKMSSGSNHNGKITIKTNVGEKDLPVKLAVASVPRSVIPSPTNTTLSTKPVYEDNMQKPGDWCTSSDGQGGWSYGKGGFIGTMKLEQNWMRWCTLTKIDKVSNFIAEVSVKPLEDCASTSCYGIIFRLSDNDNRLHCAIYDLGKKYELAQKYNGVWTTLLDAQIIGGSSSQIANRLRVECIDDRITVYVNDYKQGTASTANLTSGKIGVTVGTGKGTLSTALFNNFRLYK